MILQSHLPRAHRSNAEYPADRGGIHDPGFLLPPALVSHLRSRRVVLWRQMQRVQKGCLRWSALHLASFSFLRSLPHFDFRSTRSAALSWIVCTLKLFIPPSLFRFPRPSVHSTASFSSVQIFSSWRQLDLCAMLIFELVDLAGKLLDGTALNFKTQ